MYSTIQYSSVQCKYRWWTAKYDNAPRYRGTASTTKLGSGCRLYQSAPDLSLQEGPGGYRTIRAGSLCTTK